MELREYFFLQAEIYAAFESGEPVDKEALAKVAELQVWVDTEEDR